MSTQQNTILHLYGFSIEHFHVTKKCTRKQIKKTKLTAITIAMHAANSFGLDHIFTIGWRVCVCVQQTQYQTKAKAAEIQKNRR